MGHSRADDHAAYRRRRRTDHQLVTCRLCDEGFRSVSNHVRLHGVTIAEYKARFPGEPTVAPDVRDKLSGHAYDRALDRFGRTRPDGLEYWWTAERIIAAIQRWTKKRGRAPKTYEWSPGTQDYPCAAMVKLRFGSWSNGLRAAGVLDRAKRKQRPRWSNGNRRRRFTHEQVIAIRKRAKTGEAYSALAREYGVDLTTIRALARGELYADVGGPRCGRRRVLRK